MKNYKVTSSRMYAGQVLNQRVYYYRWYWMADLRSWFEYNFWGRDCNTYVRDGADVKHRPVVWK